jgi:hypothetical protein
MTRERMNQLRPILPKMRKMNFVDVVGGLDKGAEAVVSAGRIASEAVGIKIAEGGKRKNLLCGNFLVLVRDSISQKVLPESPKQKAFHLSEKHPQNKQVAEFFSSTCFENVIHLNKNNNHAKENCYSAR